MCIYVGLCTQLLVNVNANRRWRRRLLQTLRQESSWHGNYVLLISTSAVHTCSPGPVLHSHTRNKKEINTDRYLFAGECYISKCRIVGKGKMSQKNDMSAGAHFCLFVYFRGKLHHQNNPVVIGENVVIIDAKIVIV